MQYYQIKLNNDIFLHTYGSEPETVSQKVGSARHWAPAQAGMMFLPALLLCSAADLGEAFSTSLHFQVKYDYTIPF